MNIPKAIRRLETYLKYRKPEPMDNFNEAIGLGIEALKRLKALSPYPHEYLGGPLQGETDGV